MSELKDSGKGVRQFATGAQRDNADGKERFDLLPISALARIAGHYEKGAKKYGENNWRKGIPRQEFLKSGLRHLFKLLRGDKDEDHAAAVAWNILCFIETEELGLDVQTEEQKPAWDPACCRCHVSPPCGYCTGDEFDPETFGKRT